MLYRTVPVVNRVGTEINSRVEENSDETTKGVRLREARNLVPELEIVEDFLHIGRETIKIGNKVITEVLRVRAGLEVPQRERGDIVKPKVRGLAKRRPLVGDARLVERRLHLHHRGLGFLRDRIQAAQHGHGKDDVAVFSANVKVAQHVVRNVPNEIRYPTRSQLVIGLSFVPLSRHASAALAIDGCVSAIPLYQGARWSWQPPDASRCKSV
jgi:hypothetical protein